MFNIKLTDLPKPEQNVYLTVLGQKKDRMIFDITKQSPAPEPEQEKSAETTTVTTASMFAAPATHSSEDKPDIEESSEANNQPSDDEGEYESKVPGMERYQA